MTRDREFGPQARRYRWRVALADEDARRRRRVTRTIDAQPGLDLVWAGESAAAFLAWLADEPAADHPALLVLDATVAPEGPELRRSGIRVLRRIDDELVAAIWAELGHGRHLSSEAARRMGIATPRR